MPEEIKKELNRLLNGGMAVDLALFGRMLADLPNKNIDAACQVAHALSTNKVSMEFDFFTAVDDLSPEEETGAGMMGTVEFNSACFYRYANIDLKQLTGNLAGDSELAQKAVEAFLRAAVATIPTGKQNSMAAQNPPSLVFAVVRDKGLWSLANAFVKTPSALMAKKAWWKNPSPPWRTTG
jgi:CRISPR system Cascade subunit CasC